MKLMPLKWIVRHCVAATLIALILLVANCSRPPVTPERRTGDVVGEMNIIPKPQAVQRLRGKFELTAETLIVALDETGNRTATALNEALAETYGIKLRVIGQPTEANSIAVVTSAAEETQAEGYELNVEPGKVLMKGTEPGLFYAIQSFLQLFPYGRTLPVDVPAVEIKDAPRFRYRGMHLDVARHFMPAEFVKKYIALMARYKYNYFHWHLTDDQGWRLEIRKYPKLTEIGSKRPETVVGKNYRPFVGDGKPVEGFYTQDEIRDIVAFAAARQVTIIPEIEMPGHSSAALAAYPEFGCKNGYEYRVKTTWGGFPDVLCPTESTFSFIDDVLAEVVELFPASPYLHIGGDEVMIDHWRDSSAVRELRKRHNLATEKDLESWFVRRVEGLVNAKGKKIIGWDEVLGEGVAPSATIMSWRGMNFAVEAARAGHDVIVTPSDFTYFDHPQGDTRFEPLSLGKEVALETVYQFEPVPPNLNPDESTRIIGGQGCVWTEFLKKTSDVEYMVFPRIAALAEVLWSKQEKRNFREFSKRLEGHFAELDRSQFNYRIPRPLGFEDRLVAPMKPILVELLSPVRNGQIYLTNDGTDPHRGSSLYTQPFPLSVQPGQTIEIKARIIGPNGRESGVFAARFASSVQAPGRLPVAGLK
ncbi:MAG: family 20 glycosylhydrolase [Acidobacteria bacterium]|nr:family 20 glycosylhydrolase [Acidobacteriota bacterium]